MVVASSTTALEYESVQWVIQMRRPSNASSLNFQGESSPLTQCFGLKSLATIPREILLRHPHRHERRLSLFVQMANHLHGKYRLRARPLV